MMRDSPEPFEIRPVGVIRTGYRQKFAVPRQSGLVKAALGRVEFVSEWKVEEVTRELEVFSHLWLIFQFHRVGEEEEKSLVRPPRLGGNQRVGVFATRSPYHPNRLGMSVVELLSIEEDHLVVAGADLVDGTPIIDLKPYLPYADQVPEARGGFAEAPPEKGIVVWEVSEEEARSLPQSEKLFIEESLQYDTRPATHHESDRVYHAELASFDVSWKVKGNEIQIIALRALSGD